MNLAATEGDYDRQPNWKQLGSKSRSATINAVSTTRQSGLRSRYQSNRILQRNCCQRCASCRLRSAALRCLKNATRRPRRTLRIGCTRLHVRKMYCQLANRRKQMFQIRPLIDCYICHLSSRDWLSDIECSVYIVLVYYGFYQLMQIMQPAARSGEVWRSIAICLWATCRAESVTPLCKL